MGTEVFQLPVLERQKGNTTCINLLAVNFMVNADNEIHENMPHGSLSALL